MALTVATKQALINDYQIHGTDTGSAPVQVAMLSERINQLSQHLQRNNQDYASRQGLLKMIGRRKRLLSYIRQRDDGAYRELIKRLKLRG
ncbi:MAG: 30S ribosomal protein S15 [Synechococcus sp. SB0662_bin_45]|uniref:Small ribosomal subunit protein uS15 n=1 Tax=Synechococcus sp. SB0676_bin_10 TaxID=2604869 RepID=A0A6B1F3V6_9SYNE|nr:30S ribosomal protein S15 [Cyanobacteria bacterium MAG IRC3_bin_20]MDE0646888.1 30S ribosomal protein S15 [Cyanobacteria bacterium MAG IRC4_bin_6]MXW11729.1 30S ribosomal protein S15 [Synechococcus sp. SB0668_bin_13]MXX08288.1 30S ribosomal protein S15 [Synechococcus sp. SB0667_bin_8]MXY19380.1 30S ribosomal protein S15 [Synechococcus sp. SB0664_bin_36]MYE21012.1 30S ribosomal protein S15 [Synechococcus sp. SB0662_bin_45]MYG37661.1 30S ribosomal protein S15 [Synechococcus sp. SB0676_bin_10